nr:MAG: wsv045-like protein [Penaeus semisulcatus pemonivirus]
MDDTSRNNIFVDRRKNLRQFSDALICYARAVTDTWAYIVDPKTCGRENGAAMLCNPMASMRHHVEQDSDKVTRVYFDIQVDDETSAGQTAMLLIAIDSFVAIVSRGRTGSIVLPANSEGGFDMESSIIGHGWTNPAGASGVFKYWQCSSSCNSLTTNTSTSPLLTTKWMNHPPTNETVREAMTIGSGSVFMTPDAAQQLANTCQNLKSIKRMRSLLCRYARFARAQAKTSKERWRWCLDASPLKLSLDLCDKLIDIGTVLIHVRCRPSDRFGSVRELVTATKNWVTATHALINRLQKNSIIVKDDDDIENMDAMSHHPPLVGENAISLINYLTLADIQVTEVIRSRMVYRIPKQTMLHQNQTNTVCNVSDMANAGLGLTTDKYDKAVMVMDALLGEGSFYTSALNHMFFYRFFEEQGYPRLFHRNLAELVDTVAQYQQGAIKILRTFRNSSSRMRNSRLATESMGLTKLRETGAMKAICEYTSAQ